MVKASCKHIFVCIPLQTDEMRIKQKFDSICDPKKQAIHAYQLRELLKSTTLTGEFYVLKFTLELESFYDHSSTTIELKPVLQQTVCRI